MGLIDTLKKMFGGGGDSPAEAPQDEAQAEAAPQEETAETSSKEENTQM